MGGFEIFLMLVKILHVAVCLMLIAVVLFQQGKGADLAGAFGGAGSQTALGARQASTLMGRITTGAAVVFMLSSLVLSVGLSMNETKKGLRGIEDVEAATRAPVSATQSTAEPDAEDAPASEAIQLDLESADDAGLETDGDEADSSSAP